MRSMEHVLLLTSAMGAFLLTSACSEMKEKVSDKDEGLEEEIRALGYTLPKAKSVYIDLVGTRFGSSDYRALQYGKPDELPLSVRYPVLMPFLPLQGVVFAERGESLLVVPNPLYLKELFPQPELTDIFVRWDREIRNRYWKISVMCC